MGRDYKSAIRRSFDTDIDALRTIDPTHGMIHRGRHLNRDIYSSDIDTSQGSRIAFLSTKEAHVLPIGNWSAGSRLEIWEDVTLTSTGVALTSYNSKRSSTYVQGLTVFSGIAIYDISKSGTNIRTYYDGSAGGGPNKNSGTVRANEIEILEDIYYIAWLIPDADNTKGVVGVDWYEPEK